MLVYRVKDHTGDETYHLAVNKDSAIQAHLVHFGLSYLSHVPEVSDGKNLGEFEDRSIICWDTYCCLAAATTYSNKG